MEDGIDGERREKESMEVDELDRQEILLSVEGDAAWKEIQGRWLVSGWLRLTNWASGESAFKGLLLNPVSAGTALGRNHGTARGKCLAVLRDPDLIA